MNGRVLTATRLGFREQARRPLLLVLLVALPFFFITRAIERTEPLPRLVGLPGGGDILTTMKDVHGASMVTPAIRCSTSVTERSGSLPMSSATIESTTSSASCLSFCADCSAARWPLTTTTAWSATWAWAAPGASAAWAKAGLACSMARCATAAAIAVLWKLFKFVS